MTRRKQSAIDALSDQAVRAAGAATRSEYLTGEPPKTRQRSLGAGKGDDHRPVLVSPEELARRKRLLWVECAKCGREQMRKQTPTTCARCGASMPTANQN
jgi:ribosomal protein S27E